MEIHNFDFKTRVYLSTTKAEVDPMSPGNHLVPAFCTTKPLPQVIPPGSVPVFDVSKDEWTLISVESVEVGGGSSKSLPEKVAALRQMVVILADGTARSWGFTDINEAVTYAEEPAVPEFQRRGKALRAWRSLLWAAFEPMELAFLAGTIQLPESQSALFDALPAFVYVPAG